MPKAFNETERARITARLIAAGKRIINQVGVRLLVVDDIAREAGISKGSFYSFYPSREDFILSIFESWESEYRGALIREVVEGEGSARERIERFFLGTFEILEREPGLAHLGNIAYRLGRKLKFDPKAEKFVGDTEADGMLTRHYRAPFVVPETV